MSEMAMTEQTGAQGWDDSVVAAILSSGVDASVLLGSCSKRVSIPDGLDGLMSALLQFIAPEAPSFLRVYTYDVRNLGSVLEIGGARQLSSLPDQMIEQAGQMGLKVKLTPQPTACAVMVTLPRIR